MQFRFDFKNLQRGPLDKLCQLQLELRKTKLPYEFEIDRRALSATIRSVRRQPEGPEGNAAFERAFTLVRAFMLEHMPMEGLELWVYDAVGTPMIMFDKTIVFQHQGRWGRVDIEPLGAETVRVFLRSIVADGSKSLTVGWAKKDENAEGGYGIEGDVRSLKVEDRDISDAESAQIIIDRTSFPEEGDSK